MDRLYWNALHRDQAVLVHGHGASPGSLNKGEVLLVDSARGAHSVAIFLTSGPRSGSVIRPTRFEVHLDPRESGDCWRCTTPTIAPVSPARS